MSGSSTSARPDGSTVSDNAIAAAADVDAFEFEAATIGIVSEDSLVSPAIRDLTLDMGANLSPLNMSLRS
jgi:hypothetical protein